MTEGFSRDQATSQTADRRSGALLALYNGAWMAAMPFLSLSKRLREGFKDRLAPQGWGAGPGARGGWQDIWIQAASVGESYLACEIFKRFPIESAGDGRPGTMATLLASTCTSQGLGILDAGAAWCRSNRPQLGVSTTYFPFDAPHIMGRALRQILPKVVVLLETELWPGLLAACAREEVPVLIVNGRLSRKSLAGYLAFPAFFRQNAPAAVIAVSETDANRYALLFGAGRVSRMHNIKFDRFESSQPQEGNDSHPLARLLGQTSAFVVFGSFRKPEEHDILACLPELHLARPGTTIGLFPRHAGRLNSIARSLDRMGLPWIRRSRLNVPATPGDIILWDSFGELGQAYALAQAAFVGGTLRPLGGQNFLEPLAHGLIPCIGPCWDNFAWVGQDIVTQGLVNIVANRQELVTTLLQTLAHPQPRAGVRSRFAGYVANRRGGTDQACECIARYAWRSSS